MHVDTAQPTAHALTGPAPRPGWRSRLRNAVSGAADLLRAAHAARIPF